MFEVVAATVKIIVSDSVVDMTFPEVQLSLLIPFLIGCKVGGLSSGSNGAGTKICYLLVFLSKIYKMVWGIKDALSFNFQGFFRLNYVEFTCLTSYNLQINHNPELTH